MGQCEVGMGNSHTRPAPFNFLNRTGMGIVFNKRDEVGMGATRPKLAPLSFLNRAGLTCKSKRHHFDDQKIKKIKK